MLAGCYLSHGMHASCRPALHRLPDRVPPRHACRGKAYLHVRVVGGKAFTDYLARAPRPGEQLVLSMELFGQRVTLPAVAAGKWGSSSCAPARLGQSARFLLVDTCRHPNAMP